MITSQRVLHGSTDVSLSLNDYRSGSYTFAYQTGEYLYIGSVVPFNNLWFEVGTANDQTSSVAIDLWFGNTWVSAVDIIDETAVVSGKSLSGSGRINWSTDINKSWDLEQRSSNVTGLSGTNIYNLYWARFSWSANLKNTTSLSYIGQKFSTDDILFSFYPDFAVSALLTGFETGKTSWDEQHFMAAEHIVRDLIKRSIIFARGQILDASLFIDASCHKVAEIVYASFGAPYAQQKSEARKAYNEAMDQRFLNLDNFLDGRLDPEDRVSSVGWLNR